MIRIENLRKTYPQGTTPFKNVNTVINDGDVIAIIGPSGTGKSTFLRCINMLDAPTEGKIFVDDEDITSPDCNLENLRRKVGMVFQSFNLFLNMTVLDNVICPQVELLGTEREIAKEKAMKLLRQVGMANQANKYPIQISGGQKQRAAIARTLAMNPEVILLDEPTSALDPSSVGEVESVIRTLAKSGTTILMVTHSMQLARSISNRIFFMADGGIYEEGTPEEIFDHPKKELTKIFINSLKTLEVDVNDGNFDCPGAIAQISEFASRNQISRVNEDRLGVALQEFVIDIYGIERIKNGKLKAILKYSQKKDAVKITFKYDGDKFDPTALSPDALNYEDANLALERITKDAKKVSFIYDDEAKLNIFDIEY